MSVAPDGSPVELYLALPGDTEARLIHAAVPEAAEILELGCGAGRVTRCLADLGHTVIGVDNSAEMLSALPHRSDIEVVLADIESLDLARRFPVVLLASHMVNGREGGLFLHAAAQHVTDDGVVLVQRHRPGWIDAAEPTETEHHDIRFQLIDVTHPEPGVLDATSVYTVAGTTYRQQFVAFEVDDSRLADLARSAGLRVVGHADEDGCWVVLGVGDARQR